MTRRNNFWEYSHKKPNTPKASPPQFEEKYVVQKGDDYLSIADKFNVDLDYLIRANPHIQNPHKIVPGDVLCVPKKQKDQSCK